MKDGWLKLHRQFLNWEWYNDINVKVLFLHLLLRVNIEDKKWCGRTIKAGSLATSIKHLSEETGLTQQQIRTALTKLKKTGEINKQTTSQNTLISINNWDVYQTNNKQITNEQQTNNKQITTTKEIKKERNKENNISSDFENFFSLYPRKEVKKEAAKCFEKALKDGVMLSIILDGVKRYNRFIEEKKVERRFIKLPTTWLNQGCWDDDYGESVENAPKIVPLFIDENASYQSIEASGDLFFLTSYANLSGFKYQSSRDEADRIFESTRSAKRVDEYCRKVLGWGYNEQARENCC
jgi:hypothetical protein